MTDSDPLLGWIKNDFEDALQKEFEEQFGVKHEDDLPWWIARDEVCEFIGAETFRLLNEHEADAQRRAMFWLVGRRLVQTEHPEGDPEGARAMHRWMLGMLGLTQPA